MKVVSSVDSAIVSIDAAARQYEASEVFIVVSWTPNNGESREWALLNEYVSRVLPGSYTRWLKDFKGPGRGSTASETTNEVLNRVLGPKAHKPYDYRVYAFRTFEDMIRELAKEI